MAAIEAKPNTITAPIIVSFLVGQVIRKVSCLTSCINFKGFFITFFGRSGGTRTHNLRFWRPALYQLNYAPKRLFYYFSYYSCSNCFSTFPYCKIQFLIHCNRCDQLNCEFSIITWHNHFCARW